MADLEPVKIFFYVVKVAAVIIMIAMFAVLFDSIKDVQRSKDLERFSVSIAEGLMSSPLTYGKYVFDPQKLDEIMLSGDGVEAIPSELPFLRACDFGYYAEIEDLATGEKWEFGYDAKNSIVGNNIDSFTRTFYSGILKRSTAETTEIAEDQLSEIDGTGYRMQEAAARAMEKAIADAAAEGVDIQITSAYRTDDEQRQLYDALHDAQAVATAGHSTHNLARGAIGIDIANYDEAKPFMEANGFVWRNYRNDAVHFDYVGYTSKGVMYETTHQAKVTIIVYDRKFIQATCALEKAFVAKKKMTIGCFQDEEPCFSLMRKDNSVCFYFNNVADVIVERECRYMPPEILFRGTLENDFYQSLKDLRDSGIDPKKAVIAFYPIKEGAGGSCEEVKASPLSFAPGDSEETSYVLVCAEGGR